MRSLKKAGSMACPAAGLLLAAVLVLLMLPVRAYAGGYHADNDAGNTMQGFPAAGSDETEMTNNRGTIGMLYSSGHIANNYGTVDDSAGVIGVNHGTIKTQRANRIGINRGTVEMITNTAVLAYNDTDGCVGENLTTVEMNYGTITTNAGTVTMYGGKIEANTKIGKAVFEGAASQGTVVSNDGEVTVNGSTAKVYITTNTGKVTISNATVVMEENSGVVTLGDKGTLICTNNTGTVTKEESAETYCSDCTNNYGTITFLMNSDKSFSSRNEYCKVVFSGDEGKASVIGGEKEYKGVMYTSNGNTLTFTLPEDRVCTNTNARHDAADRSTWYLVTYTHFGDSCYTVFCEKRCVNVHDYSDTYYVEGNGHYQICRDCGKRSEIAVHTGGRSTCIEKAKCAFCNAEYGAFTDHNFSGMSSDETKHWRQCSVCGVTKDMAAHIDKDGNRVCDVCARRIHLHSGTKTEQVDATCTECGVKAYYGCTCGKYFTDAECTDEITDLSAWKSGEGKIDAQGHHFTDKASARKASDATCTERAAYYVCCDRCDAVDTVRTVAVGDAAGHNYGDWMPVSSTQHQRICANDAAHIETADHHFTDNKCDVCGYEIKAEPASCTVTFCMNGHGLPVAAQRIEVGGRAVEPARPAAAGYSFRGWYADAALSEKFDFDTAITADTTVYAKWTKNAAPSAEPSSPRTGDNSHMLLWIALLLVSGSTAAGAAVYGKKELRDQ